MNPNTTGTAGVHYDAGGNEVHDGSGQGANPPSMDHSPANLSRSGAIHGAPGAHAAGVGSTTQNPVPSGIGESTARLDKPGMD